MILLRVRGLEVTHWTCRILSNLCCDWTELSIEVTGEMTGYRSFA
ncbi:hypothetical protein [Paenibacillus sp. SYP-B4298]|nr:hypothetical protein [Paenibacillus sp. SYP-B4298]